MKAGTALITGSSGLIGSAVAELLCGNGWTVVGVDNDARARFFGADGSTQRNLVRIKATLERFEHVELDVSDRAAIISLARNQRFDAVVHCAAQPSHDRAAKDPFLDFDVNAVGTLNLLEACRQNFADAPFCFCSTNKVYGDAPNEYETVELATRYDYADIARRAGVDEQCRVDQCLHSLFGASKASADLLCQEYGRYFGMPVGVFRFGCVTGQFHAGVEQHGFLSYLARAIASGLKYTVYGYNGKQVRDQLAASDAASAFAEFIEDPRPGEVYNMGGGRENSASVLESICAMELRLGKALDQRYWPEPRLGDHKCYITDCRKFQSHYPGWMPAVDLESLFNSVAKGAQQ